MTEIKVLKQSIHCKEMLSIINDKKLAEANKKIEELEAQLDYTIKFNLKLVKEIMDLKEQSNTDEL